MKKFVLIVGLSGAGKSTLLLKAKNSIEGLHRVNYGRVILSIADSKHLQPDNIHKQTHEVQKDLRLQAAKKIVSESSGLTLIDTHSLIKTKFGLMPGIPKEIVEIIQPKGLVLIKSSPSDIYQRRLGDKFRIKDKQNVEDIKLHQELSQSFMAACSFYMACPLMVIENREGQIDKSHLDFVRFLESIQNNTEN